MTLTFTVEPSFRYLQSVSVLYIFGIALLAGVPERRNRPKRQQYLSNEGVRDWRGGFIGSHLVSRLLESEKPKDWLSMTTSLQGDEVTSRF